MKHGILILSFNQKKIGELKINTQDNQLFFCYESDWIKDGFAISPHLPLENLKEQNQNISVFIENLLPEEENRELLARSIGISRTSIFGLIKKIGLETTGAITFSEEFPLSNQDAKFRLITNKELITKLENDSTESLVYWDGKPRLSIAGVQRKLPIIILEKKMGLGDGSLCSTHILKFQKNQMAKHSIVLNEYICMKLADKCKLKVPFVEYKKVGKYPLLLVKRFDRKLKTKRSVDRIHVIDGCQAMNLPLSHKYERPYGDEGQVKDYREGASFEKLFDALNHCQSPLLAKLSVIRWMIFNLIIGNTDFHAKNISFFINPSGMSLTPFYDILNTEIYSDKFNTDLAFSIGDEFKLKDIGAYQLAQFCDDLQIKRKLLKDEFIKISNQIITQFNSIKIPMSILTQDEIRFFDELKQSILNRANYYLKEMDEIMELKLVN